MNKRLNRGITIIALVITIIVLLILAGVSIAMLTGENGILIKTESAKVKTEEETAREKLELVLLDMRAEKELNPLYNEKEFLTNKLKEKEFTVLDDIVIVDNYQFQIDRNVPCIVKKADEEIKNPEEIEIPEQLSSTFEYIKDESEIETEKSVKRIKDKTGKSSDAEMNDVSFLDNEKGIVFNGESTYGILDSDKVNLSCPTTITAVVKWESGNNNLLFIDAKSKIGIGAYNNKILLTAKGETSYYYEIPADFFTNEVNYITVQYNQDVTDNMLYINGEKMQQLTSKSSWNLSESGTYLGRRRAGSYFKGILYNFKIYNKLFSEQEVLYAYEYEKSSFENDTNINDIQSEFLVLEYSGNKQENIEDFPTILRNNNIEVELNEVEFDIDGGLMFNGTSAYCEFKDNAMQLQFPNTITIVAKCNDVSENILFTDEKTKIGIGFWKNKYMILENSASNVIFYNIETEILKEDINYITVVYGNSASESSLYLNGQKIENTTSGLGWNRDETGTYFGRRNSGSYFNGTLYKFKIYSKSLSDSEIIEEYNNDKNIYSTKD